MPVYAIFSRRERGRKRTMHAAREGEWQTVCGHPVGRGSGLVRDGDYRDNVPCPRCWPSRNGRTLTIGARGPFPQPPAIRN
jgi:hypothetical protein